VVRWLDADEAGARDCGRGGRDRDELTAEHGVVGVVFGEKNIAPTAQRGVEARSRGWRCMACRRDVTAWRAAVAGSTGRGCRGAALCVRVHVGDVVRMKAELSGCHGR
jgi:hypothetical protein